jgi:hypothetical protein
MMSYELIKLLIYGTFSEFRRGTRGSRTTGGALEEQVSALHRFSFL